MNVRVQRKVEDLPDEPGIYVFLGPGGEPLYVGKAKSLRKRVAAYAKVEEPRLRAMVDEAVDLDHVLASSEQHALLLENTWIKSRQPRYNIRLRDDKTYPYLKLTLQDPYPRLVFTRRIRRDGAEYYGPFLPAGLARRAIKLVQRFYGIRVCGIEIDGKLPRPCLYYDTERCLGPCVDGLTTPQEYAAAVAGARDLLSGRSQGLVDDLKRRMSAAAEALEFEAAARHRDDIAEIESLLQRRRVSSDHAEDVDIYGYYAAAGNVAVSILVVRDGKMLDRRELFWEGEGAPGAARLLSEILPQVYDRTTMIPREIHLPVAIEGEEALTGWLSERRGTRVYLRVPARGPKAERVQLASSNARQAYRRRFRLRRDESLGALRLQDLLGLEGPPTRIEGFDISTFHGRETVASLVVWQEGRFSKKDYRTFNIRGLEHADDFASLRQAVERRVRRILDETLEMPDLILIDGGRGQLNAALEGLIHHGMDETPIVALAKREEEVFTPERIEPLRLSRHDEGLKLLQQIRDEAHRFAVSRHRRRRKKSALRSRFDDLRGVGAARRKKLVRRFGSFRGVRGATRQELQDALGRRLGSSVFDQIHGD